MTDIDKLLDCCLYFTASKLSRIITKMAEEEFKITGLSPTYAFLVNIVNEREGLTQKTIGDLLHVKPSTVTRFIDKLETKDLVERRVDGKKTLIYSTLKGKEIQKDIDRAWTSLYDRYSAIIGYEAGDELTIKLDEIGDLLNAE